MEEKRDDDRISGLPDCVLLEILSRLPSITYAIRTGTLSKRWERLWTLVPSLIFIPQLGAQYLQSPNSESDFALLVSKTLTQCRQLKRKKLEVQALYDYQYESDFNDWIRYAISCNVEELNLDLLESEAEFLLDQDVFISSCFTNLRLAGCRLNPRRAISWENLRSLEFFKVFINEDLLVNIVSGSPLLETLVLEHCITKYRRWYDSTSESDSDSASASEADGINAPTSLSLTQCRQLKLLKKFKLDIGCLTQFQLKYNNWIRYAIRCNVQELDLQLYNERYEDEFVLDQILFTSSCFTDLRISGCKLNPTGAISWENLRSLCISNAIIDEDSLVNVVSGSPLLETLVLEHCWWPNITSDDSVRIIAPPSFSLTQCRQLEHLKKFKLDICNYMQFHSQLNDWIRYAIRCSVQELNLMSCIDGYEDEYVLDQFVFTGSCFTELRLKGWMLNPVGAISWKNLRSLCISDYQSLDEDLIENILSGSHVLETLVLNDCYGYRRLDITSKIVKNLELDGYRVPYGECEANIIEINAPNNLSLSIEGEFLCKHLLLNASSLVKAFLNYTCIKFEHHHTTPTETEQETLKGCIMKLRHVKKLELGVSCAWVLSCLQDKGFVSPSNVKLDREW